MMRELFGFRLNEIPLDSVTIIWKSVAAMVSGQGQHRQRLNPDRPDQSPEKRSAQDRRYLMTEAEDTMTRHFIRSAGPYVKHVPTTRLECSTSRHVYKVARLDCTRSSPGRSPGEDCSVRDCRPGKAVRPHFSCQVDASTCAVRI